MQDCKTMYLAHLGSSVLWTWGFDFPPGHQLNCRGSADKLLTTTAVIPPSSSFGSQVKGAITNIAISLGTILTLLVLFEVYLWIRYEREYERLEARYEDHERCTRRARDPALIYEFIPNKCGFNSSGFADIDHALEKTSFRILLIGDSVAQGNGVARDKRFGNVLAKHFDATPELSEVEIINLARGGYSTSQKLIVLQQMGFAYDPDLILWSYVLNDPAHPLFHDANGELGRYFYRPRWRGLHYLEKKLFEARENSQHDHCGTEFHRILHCAYRDQVATHIRQLGALSRERAIPVMFIIHPIFEENRNWENYGQRAIHEDLRQMAESAGMRVVDLIEAFRGVATEKLTQQHKPWFDPWHPNELGHRLIADHLFKELQNLELDVLR